MNFKFGLNQNRQTNLQRDRILLFPSQEVIIKSFYFLLEIENVPPNMSYYKDNAGSVDEPGLLAPGIKQQRKGPRGGVQVPFPKKLYALLEDDLFKDVISWQPHGRSFLVRKPTEFVKNVMPKYFKQSKLASFQRQLNLYGFTRLSASGPDKGGYFHELFLRGKEHMCSRIIRMKIKGPRVKGPRPRDRDEPKFYKMKFLPSTLSRAQDQRNCSVLRTEASKSISMPNQETPLYRSSSASDNHASSNFQHLEESSSNMINLNDSSRMLSSDFPTNISLLSYPTFSSFLAEEDNGLGTEPLSWAFDLDLMFTED